MSGTTANDRMDHRALLEAPIGCVSESDSMLLVDTSDLRKIAREVRELVGLAQRAGGRAQDARLLSLTKANAAWLDDLADQIEACGYIAKQSYARPRLEELEQEQRPQRKAAR